MSDVCVIRHQSYTKSQTHFPFRHNMRTLKNYSNSNIDLSFTKLNSAIENNLLNGETYLKAFTRLHKSRAFTGQLKVQGDEKKQTKYLDEFLVYPPYEAISKMTLEEQDAFFQKELKAIQKYFKDIIILSAVVHRDEVFHPIDEDMKALFPDGKITPHMHITTIPIVHDKKSDCKKISISELWKGRNSYRKFQVICINPLVKSTALTEEKPMILGKQQSIWKLKHLSCRKHPRHLAKLESAIIEKEQEISERAKILEPEEHISIMNEKNEIIPYCKGHAEAGMRYLPLTDACKRILSEIKRIIPDSEYLFIQDSKPLVTVTFNRRIKKCCKELGIDYRSSHKIRFSTASIMHKRGADNTELQELLGHTDLNMTNKYLKNITPRSETCKKANQFLD